MEKHINILGILYIVISGFHLMAAIIVFTILFGAGIITGDDDALTILTIIASFVAVILVVTSLPGIVGGIGVLKMHQWARILLIILGFLNLLVIPFGTILGVYTIWVLLNNETIELFNCKSGITNT